MDAYPHGDASSPGGVAPAGLSLASPENDTRSVGVRDYERVNELVAGGSTRADAFEAIAQQEGRQSGSVQSNFYRIAAQRNDGTVARRTRRRRTPTRGVRPVPAARPAEIAKQSELARVTRQLTEAMGDLTRIALANEKELEQLRAQDRKLQDIKKMLT